MAVDTVALTANSRTNWTSATRVPPLAVAGIHLLLLLDGLQAHGLYFLQVTNPPGNNGAIDLTVTGGLFDLVMDPGAYVVSWSGPGGFTSQDEDLVNLAPGAYTATVTDITGCVDDIVITVSVTVPTTDPKSVRTLHRQPQPDSRRSVAEPVADRRGRRAR